MIIFPSIILMNFDRKIFTTFLVVNECINSQKASKITNSSTLFFASNQLKQHAYGNEPSTWFPLEQLEEQKSFSREIHVFFQNFSIFFFKFRVKISTFEMSRVFSIKIINSLFYLLSEEILRHPIEECSMATSGERSTWFPLK